MTPSDTNQSESIAPAAPVDLPDDVKNRIEWLVREQEAAVTDEQRALLYFESAVARERGRDEAGAARDYLASYNADSEFREPVESLAVLLERRKSFRNLGRLLEALARAATTPEQVARASLLRGIHLLEHESDPSGARDAFEQAVTDEPDLAAGWLELEILAGKTEDGDLRLRALEERVRLSAPAEWKALLLLDLAKEEYARGSFDRALDHILAATDLDTPYKYRAFCLLEAIAHREQREDLVADALRSQAGMVLAAMDGDAVSVEAVPASVRTPVHVADLFLRGAEAKRRAGDLAGAVSLLDLAVAKLPDDGALLFARLEAAESANDVETSAALASRILAQGNQGRGAAALWMRIFEGAAARGDREGALEALARAVEADPGCVPARALQLDLLIDSEPAAFASSLEAMAGQGLSDEGKGRAYLVSSWAWALAGNDVDGAKAAMAQAAMFGVPHGVVSRLARAFATLVGDDGWYEESTKRLIAAGASPDEHASLWFELARSRMLRGDPEAEKAVSSLADAAGGIWLGRVLGAYVLGLRNAGAQDSGAGRSPEQLEQLASVEEDPPMARALSVVAVIRRIRAGDRAGAVERLRALHEADVDDLLVAVLLADLERAAGNVAAAAGVLSACAASVADPDVAVALRLESAFLLWRAGDRASALNQIRSAREQLPDASVTALLWATAAVEANSLDGRRRVIEASEECGADKVSTALERFAVECCEGGDADQAAAALDVLERDALGELGVAGWLGRLIHAPQFEDATARGRALEGLETLGLRASAVVAAERYRYARAEEKDRDAARDFAQAWAMADGGVGPAIEWLAAAKAAEDVESEASARRLLARHVQGATACALEASATLIELTHASAVEQPSLMEDSHHPAQLTNLELAPAGCDPRRRARALLGLTDALGDQAKLDAKMLAGWSLVAAGDGKQALEAFRRVCGARDDDLVAWEGVRTAASMVGDVHWNATACERLGALCTNDARAAEFYERAGLLWIDQGDDPERGELALAKGFQRDGHRFVCFDRLFRRVRAREDNDYLLTLIARRLEFAEDTTEIGKMFWEQARVLRQKGDFDAAMSALENVTMLEPDHVGALALSGEVYIRQGEFGEAVGMLARLAGHREAPAQQRLVSGMAAVDLCENKLNDHKKAMEVLMTLHTTGLSTLPVRERLAKSAAKNEAWAQATAVLETLMHERENAPGRIQAARLAMVIHRDKIGDVLGALPAVNKLLSESPADAEALDLLITNEHLGVPRARADMLEAARRTLVWRLSSTPDADDVALLARVAKVQDDKRLRQACLGALVALGRGEASMQQELESLDGRVARTPQVALDDAVIGAIGDPRDVGPLSDLFLQLGPVITEALGPTLAGLAVTKKNRVDPRDGLPLRNEIAHWAGALGISDFELYVGGREPYGVVGVPGERPMLVVGSEITAPLAPHARQAVARELFGIRRGISVLRTRDAPTVACIVISLCGVLGVPIQSPPYAMLAETQRLMSRALPRKLKKPLTDACQAVAASGVDPIQWVPFGLSSLDRMAAIAAGDVSLVLSDVYGVPRDKLQAMVAEDQRARELVAFVLSDRYLELRNQLGMGVR
jgi:tetratricopeptide (TPR) repeat protein